MNMKIKIVFKTGTELIVECSKISTSTNNGKLVNIELEDANPMVSCINCDEVLYIVYE